MRDVYDEMNWDGMQTQIRNPAEHFDIKYDATRTKGTGREMVTVDTMREIQEACLLVPAERRNTPLWKHEIMGYRGTADNYSKMKSLLVFIDDFSNCKEQTTTGKRGRVDATVGDILRYIARMLEAWETYQSNVARLGEKHGITRRHDFLAATGAVVRKHAGSGDQVPAGSEQGREIHRLGAVSGSTECRCRAGYQRPSPDPQTKIT